MVKFWLLLNIYLLHRFSGWNLKCQNSCIWSSDWSVTPSSCLSFQGGRNIPTHHPPIQAHVYFESLFTYTSQEKGSRKSVLLTIPNLNFSQSWGWGLAMNKIYNPAHYKLYRQPCSLCGLEQHFCFFVVQAWLFTHYLRFQPVIFLLDTMQKKSVVFSLLKSPKYESFN